MVALFMIGHITSCTPEVLEDSILEPQACCDEQEPILLPPPPPPTDPETGG